MTNDPALRQAIEGAEQPGTIRSFFNSFDTDPSYFDFVYPLKGDSENMLAYFGTIRSGELVGYVDEVSTYSLQNVEKLSYISSLDGEIPQDQLNQLAADAFGAAIDLAYENTGETPNDIYDYYNTFEQDEQGRPIIKFEDLKDLKDLLNRQGLQGDRCTELINEACHVRYEIDKAIHEADLAEDVKAKIKASDDLSYDEQTNLIKRIGDATQWDVVSKESVPGYGGSTTQ